MALGKKKRFEVFKRDGFKCIYCGKTPPGVVLEVDHVKPKSKGGSDDIDNLVTSCFDCNRGKRDKSLDVVPQTVVEKYEILQEKELQIAEYDKLVNKVRARKLKDCKRVVDAFNMHYPNYNVYDSFIHGSLLRIIEKLDVNKMCDNMHYSCSRLNDANASLKYFCGVCWKQINEDYNG